MHCQVNNESEYLVVAVVDTRNQWCHAFQILHLQHFNELLTEVTLDIIYLTVPDHLLDLLRVLMTPQDHNFDHGWHITTNGQMQSTHAHIVLL